MKSDSGIKYLKTSGDYDVSRWNDAQEEGTLSEFMMGSVSGDCAYIGDGVFTFGEPLELRENVKILGGFTGTEAKPESRDSCAILDGSMNIASDSEIDGFTALNSIDIQGSPSITNFSSKRGVILRSGSPAFTHCSFTEKVIIDGGDSPAFTNCTITGGITVNKASPSFTHCTITDFVNASSSSLVNSLVWDITNSGTLNLNHCAVPEGAGIIGEDTVYVSADWKPVPSDATFRGITHKVFTLTDNPALSVLIDGASQGLATDILGKKRLSPPTIGSLEYPYDSEYEVDVPEGLRISGAGWNIQDSVTAKHKPSSEGRTFNPVKELRISAVSPNNFALKSEYGIKINYTLRNALIGPETTEWEFSAEDLDTGVTQSVGAYVEDFAGKPSGNYTDNLKFTIEVMDK